MTLLYVPRWAYDLVRAGRMGDPERYGLEPYPELEPGDVKPADEIFAGVPLPPCATEVDVDATP